MALYAIGDLHLSTGTDKPMDIFAGWRDYVARLCESWNAQVKDGDTVVLAGDTSWGMTLEQALPDFALIDSLPGKKIILKGNHDYWWSSRRKMEECFERNKLRTLAILHNNCFTEEGVALCGTRGWMIEEGTPHDRRVSAREEGRLRASLEAARQTGLEPVVFLHYPPVYLDSVSGGMIDLMHEYGVRRCLYGHLHGPSCRCAVEGEYLGLEFALISADHLEFRLKRL
mgnify:CR=1 FL=1